MNQSPSNIEGNGETEKVNGVHRCGVLPFPISIILSITLRVLFVRHEMCMVFDFISEFNYEENPRRCVFEHLPGMTEFIEFVVFLVEFCQVIRIQSKFSFEVTDG